MLDLHIPELTFRNVTYGRHETPWDLRALLYRGGAGAKANKVSKFIEEGRLGGPIAVRLSLLVKFHDYLLGNLASGGSRATAQGQIYQLRMLYQHADRTQADPTEENLKAVYVDWIAHLQQQQRLKKIKHLTAYKAGAIAGTLVADALGIPATILRHAARLYKPKASRRVLSVKADKQNLAQTTTFGHALLDLTESLSLAAMRGPLPISIRFRTGQVIEEWSGLRTPRPQRLRTRNGRSYLEPRHRREATRRLREENFTMSTRYSLVNMRVEAEMLIFIAQTSMNLAQVTRLRMGKFSYQSHLDGYVVRREYKSRRKGPVEFEIFSEYRVVFERYLEWRTALFPADIDGLLFPFVAQPGKSVMQHREFKTIRKKCAQLSIAFISPLTLRNTRLNWLLRRSKDPDLTAEMAQHSRETLLTVYEKPSHQVAMMEATRYFQQTDPAISPPGPGACVRPEAEPLPDSPSAAPQPDCISPAGCMFCAHQRDIDSLDHVWSLASYRYLKTLEQMRYHASKSAREHPSALVIDRVTEKLRAFEASSLIRSEWAKEAQARVDEGEYHPHWHGFIRLAEIGA